MRVLLLNHFPLEGSGSGVYTKNLASRLLVLGPGAHHEGVVDADTPDLVDTGGLERLGLLDIARHMLGRAGRREGAGNRKQGNRLAGTGLQHVDRIRAQAAALGFDCDELHQGAGGQLVADLDHGNFLAMGPLGPGC